MLDFFIVFISALLNCSFVYLATTHLFRAFPFATPQSAVKSAAIKFGRVVLGLGIWSGSAIYFTFGAAALIELNNPAHVGTFGDWRDTTGLINCVLPALVMMLVVRKIENTKPIRRDSEFHRG